MNIKAKVALLSMGACLAMGATQSAHSYYGYVCTYDSTSRVMLRSGPSKNYRVVARMPSGSGVEVINQRYTNGWSWYQVRYGRYVGWARSDYVCN